MANQLSNHFKYQKMAKKIDFANDTFIIILMASGFTFNRDTHATYADVSASELAGGNGYTQDTKTLVLSALTEDDSNDRASATFDDVTWTASGGSIGPTPGAIIYDQTTTDNTIVGYIDFGSEQTASDGTNFVIRNIEVRDT